MITEWLMNVGHTVGLWVVSLFPTLPAEAVHASVDPLSLIGANIGAMSVWVNWPLLVTQATYVMSLYFVFMLVKITRAILGHVPFIGGNG